MWSSLALALFVPAAPATETSIGLKLAGEALRDPWIVAGYGAEGLGGELTASLALPHHLRLRVQLGYHRRGGNLTTEADAAPAGPSWLQYTPVSLPVFYDLDLGAVRLGGGVGPAYVLFAEKPDPTDDWAQTGGKFGFTVQAEARIATQAVRHSLHDPDAGPERLDLVVDVGYRQCIRHLLLPLNTDGLDFSAVTAGLGVELVY